MLDLIGSQAVNVVDDNQYPCMRGGEFALDLLPDSLSILLAAPVPQVKPKRIWPSGGKSGGRRTARSPSQRARARPCSVARRAQP